MGAGGGLGAHQAAGLMLVPVLGLWLLLEADYATWLRSFVVSIGTFIIGIAPFQIGHPWNWIIDSTLRRQPTTTRPRSTRSTSSR